MAVGLVDPVGVMEVIGGDLAELLSYYDTWCGDGLFFKGELGIGAQRE